ncbi:MAG: diguanylate cyclase [Campylobacterales bacterium]|nr:diguanylate cyclase [Campylobacterales bacterium]
MHSSEISLHYLQEELYALINQSLFHFMEKGSLDGIWFWDLNQNENMWISPHFWQILGYRQDEMGHFSSSWKKVLFKEDFAIALEKLNKHVQYPEYPFNRILRYHHKNGSSIWLRCRAMAIYDQNGEATRIIALHNDVTAQMHDKDEFKYYQDEIAKLRQEMQMHSFHDPITNTYAHKGVEQNCKYLIEISKRDGALLSIAMFEIDALEKLSQQHNQERIDKIFKALANVLYNSTRRVDIIGRFDNEKLVVLMTNTSKEDAIMVSKRICKYVHRHPSGGVELTLSCGAATTSLTHQDDTQRSYEQLILLVDEALYHAQKEGNRVQHYEDINIVIPQIEPHNMSKIEKESTKPQDYYEREFYR